MGANIEELGGQISRLTLVETRQLVDFLKDKHGVIASFVVEGMKFDVVLKAITNRIATMGAVMRVTGMEIEDAYKLINDIPVKVKEGVSEEEANSIARQLMDSGAKVSISSGYI